MKNVVYKILFTFFLLFSCVFINASEINPYYEEYMKLDDSEKEKITLVPNKYVNYYEIDDTNLFNKNNNAGLYSLYGSTQSSYDLRNVNGTRLIPSIKDQGQLSLCWAFATNNAIESYMLKKSKTYNLSENYLDYVSRYYQDTSTFGEANSYYNVVKYLFLGHIPVTESKFGSYFTSYKSKTYNDYLDYDNVPFDITDVIVFPMLKMQYIKQNYNATNIKLHVDTYNQKIKEHIMTYGAVAGGTYWDFYDENKKFIYNDNSLTRDEYSDSGHAVTIIGWDDNYGSVKINGNTFTGSWLAMNSWGSGNDEYFYISYYDENIVEALFGVREIKDKTWDNAYIESTKYETSTYKQVYEFTKDTISEKIDSVKIFHYDDNDEFTVSVSDGYNTYTSTSDKAVKYGISTFSFDNVNFETQKVYVTITSKNGKSQYSVALYTQNNETTKYINILENDSSAYQNQITHDIMTKNINTGEKLTVKVYNESGSDITSKFQLYETMVINDVAKLKLVAKSDISSYKFIDISVSHGTTTDNLRLYKTGAGTSSDPYVIRKSQEMSKLSTSNYYFELGNDIDMTYDTTNMYGKFYNSGNGWNPVGLMGTLDGKGYKIENLTSKYGSLFTNINNSTITNIQFNKFIITDAQNNNTYSGLLGRNMTNNSSISNVFVNEANVNCTKTSCSTLIGYMQDGNISDVHIYNSKLTGSSNIGYVTSYISNPSNSINIDSVFVNKSSLNNNANYYLIGKINISSKQANLKKINISNNIVNGSSTTKSLIASKTINVTDNSSYDIYAKDLIIKNNYIKTDADVLKQTTFSDYDLLLWTFDSKNSLYLDQFSSDYVTNEIERLIKVSNYLIQNKIIYGVSDNTTVSAFLKNIENSDKLSIVFTSHQNKSLSNTDIVTTGSYIDVTLNDVTQRYYIAVSGDVNNDGMLSIFDIVKINNHIIYTDKKLTGIYYYAADFNEDKDISIFDIVKINNKIIGGN